MEYMMSPSRWTLPTWRQINRNAKWNSSMFGTSPSSLIRLGYCGHIKGSM
jgi:hypothetical protein